jgi:hypothetical protein
MPYHLEKGPLLSVLDDFFNSGSKTRLITALKELRAGVDLTSIGVFDSPNLYTYTAPDGTVKTYPYPYDSQPHLVAHFNEHWLGNPSPWPGQTAHWQFYKGPVEKIIRETLERAIELVLGLPHGGSLDGLRLADLRKWPIDFWWKCPQPWFEGWVTWRRIGSTSGHVTVIFATPADDGVVLRTPATEATEATDGVVTASEGSWLISPKQHDQTVQTTVIPTPSGAVIFPTTWTDDDNYVVKTYVPNFGSGGAQDGGKPYQGSK